MSGLPYYFFEVCWTLKRAQFAVQAVLYLQTVFAFHFSTACVLLITVLNFPPAPYRGIATIRAEGRSYEHLFFIVLGLRADTFHNLLSVLKNIFVSLSCSAAGQTNIISRTAAILVRNTLAKN